MLARPLRQRAVAPGVEEGLQLVPVVGDRALSPARGLQVAAHEDAKNRLVVWRIARQIRIDRRLPEGEVVRVTLHDQNGRVLFTGDVV